MNRLPDIHHRDPDTGETVHPAMELVRLAVPRRVYTETHLAYVADAVGALARDRERLRGLEIESAPAALRHFTARLRPLSGGLMVVA